MAGAGVASLFTLLKHAEFSVGEIIGQGRFKRVCKGTLRGDLDIVVLRYARKKGEKSELETLSLLARTPEARRFVPEIYGACENWPDTLLLQERATFGSLKIVLTESTQPDMFSPMHRIFAAAQIAGAMEFLEFAHVVHADLSCRNCLLFQHDEQDPSTVLVKVTDLGLAVVLPEGVHEEFRKQPVAVRWCAPETVTEQKLSHRADVWSLGVTLWELFSGGTNPWALREKRAGVSAILRGLAAGGVVAGAAAFEEHLAVTVKPGTEDAAQTRPFESIADEFPQPDHCPQAAHDVVLSCLRPEEMSRPPASKVAQAFHRIIEVILGVGEACEVEEAAEDPCTPNFAATSPAVPQSVPRRLVTHSAVLTSPDSVDRIFSNLDVMDFAEWASTRWPQLYEMFGRGECSAAGVFLCADSHSLSSVPKQLWCEMLRLKGFKGNASAVFDEIAGEVVGDVWQSNKAWKEEKDEAISLPQLKRFEQRIVATSATLTAADDMSAVSRFAKNMRQQRGTLLRAWRTDIDLRDTGRVAYADFANACRKLGLSAQTRLVWDCLRPDGGVAALEFHELAPDEAQNIEDFVQILLVPHGFDTEKAWLSIDENHQNFLTLQEFLGACRRVGFEGNARQLFRGLDTSGLGRVLKEDFKYISKVCSKPANLGQSARGPIADLIMWARRGGDDADQVIAHLGIPIGEREITVNDLAARLTAVGFEGDSLQVAMKVARTSGGVRISVDVLRATLAGERFKDKEPSVVSLHAPQPRATQPSPVRTPRSKSRKEQGWNNGVDNISEKNMRKCSSARMYFSPPKREEFGVEQPSRIRQPVVR